MWTEWQLVVSSDENQQFSLPCVQKPPVQIDKSFWHLLYSSFDYRISALSNTNSDKNTNKWMKELPDLRCSADLIQCIPQCILVLLQPHSLSLSIFLLSLKHGDRSLQPTQPLLDSGPLRLSWLCTALSLCMTGGALTQSLMEGKQRSHTKTWL